jgi:hypothetical protein
MRRRGGYVKFEKTVDALAESESSDGRKFKSRILPLFDSFFFREGWHFCAS